MQRPTVVGPTCKAGARPSGSIYVILDLAWSRFWVVVQSYPFEYLGYWNTWNTCTWLVHLHLEGAPTTQVFSRFPTDMGMGMMDYQLLPTAHYPTCKT